MGIRSKYVATVLVLAVTVLAACGPTMSGGSQKTVYVGSELVDCEGAGPQKCMLVRENPEDPWRPFYDQIEGFGQYGLTVSDSYYGNKLRRFLFDGGYRGGPIAIGSARFHQGSRGRPDWLPTSKAACEGPPLELALSLFEVLFGSLWIGRIE